MTAVLSCPHCFHDVPVEASRAVGITRRQRATLQALMDFIREHDRSPSYAELAIAMGQSNRSTVVRHIECLIERGYVQKLPNRAYSLEVTLPLEDNNERHA